MLMSMAPTVPVSVGMSAGLLSMWKVRRTTARAPGKEERLRMLEREERWNRRWKQERQRRQSGREDDIRTLCPSGNVTSAIRAPVVELLMEVRLEGWSVIVQSWACNLMGCLSLECSCLWAILKSSDG